MFKGSVLSQVLAFLSARLTTATRTASIFEKEQASAFGLFQGSTRTGI